MNKRGFTLVELLAVIIILGIILIIAVPKVSESINISRIEAFIKDEEELERAAESFLAQNVKYIPQNIGDTKEVKLSDLQNEKLIYTIVNPNDNKATCNGYVLVTKTGDKRYEYVPHLNCEKNIGSSSEDGLVGHYNFDNFAEATTNLLSNGDFSNGLTNWTCTTGGTGMNNTCQVMYENGEPYLHVHWERVSDSGNTWPLLKNSVTYNIVGVPYALSCKIRINGQSGSTAEIRHAAVPNDFWTSGRVVWGFGGRTLGKWQDVSLIRTFASSYTNTGGTVFPLAAVFELYSGCLETVGEYVDFDIKLIQVEQKDHSTPYVTGTRTGTVTDYSLNNYHAALAPTTTPKWVDGIVNSGAYQFDGKDDLIFLSPSIGTALQDSPFTLSAWIRPTGLASGMSLSGIISVTFGLTLSINSDGNLYGRIYNGSIFVPVITSGINLYDNKIHYVAMTYDGTIARLYVDGKNVKEVTTAWNNIYTNDSGIGFEINDYINRKFYGTIDDVRIYKRNLSDAEIKRNYDIESYKLNK